MCRKNLRIEKTLLFSVGLFHSCFSMKHRASAHEWFNVGVNLAGQQLIRQAALDLVQKLTLAPCPFQKWFCQAESISN